MISDPEHPLLLACRLLGGAFDGQDATIATGLQISRNELRLLNMLENGPRSQVEIATHLGVTRGAVTAIVDRLVTDGLVERGPSPGDRRVNLISLTPKVWRALAGHYGPAGARVLAMIDGLPTDSVEVFTAQIVRLANAIHPGSS